MARERLLALDALRGIAALSIAVYHITLRYPAFMVGQPTPSTPLLPGLMQIDAGIVPVLWFFLLSGFVITWTVDRCATPMDFVVSRVSRIYPAYWASIALAVGATALAPLPGVTHRTADVLVNLTMLQSFLLVPNASAVYWSLGVELVFYFYALALFALGQWRLVHWAALAWAALGLLAALWVDAGHAVSWRANQVLLLDDAPFLVAGMMLYRLWRGQRPAWSGVTLAVCAAAIATAYGTVPAGLCFAAMALIAWSAHGGLRWLGAAPLLFLGSVSYALYLVHEYPSYIVMRALDGRGVPHQVGMAAALAVSLALATAVTYGVERPAMRAMRGAWRRIRPAPGAPAAAAVPQASPARPGSPG